MTTLTADCHPPRDRYTYFHYDSNVGISMYSPLQWLMAKWESLPLGVQLDHELTAKYRSTIRRMKEQFPSQGYSVFTKTVSLVINIGIGIIAAGVLAPSSAQYLYLAYFVALFVILFIVSQTVPDTVATLSRQIADVRRKLEDAINLLLTEMIAVASSGRSAFLGKQIVKLENEDTDRNFDLYYIALTQSMYTRWIMDLVPIALFASAAILVEFGQFTSGEVIAIISSFGTAKANLVSLCAIREDLKVAVDLVHELADLLNSGDEAMGAKVSHTQRSLALIRDRGPDALKLSSCISLHGLTYSCDVELALLGSSSRIEEMNGSLPIGDGVIYGFEQLTETPQEQQSTVYMMIVMDLCGRLRVPNDGVALVPPHITVCVVPRDPGIIEQKSVWENLTFGLPPGEHHQGNSRYAKMVAALCVKMKMNTVIFGSVETLSRPMMQAAAWSDSQERNLLALVRTLLPMPDVLLIQDLGHLDSQHATAVHNVLRRFAQGHDLAGLIAGEPPPSPAGVARTVVWSAAPSILSRCRIESLVEISSKGGMPPNLRVRRVEAHTGVFTPSALIDSCVVCGAGEGWTSKPHTIGWDCTQIRANCGARRAPLGAGGRRREGGGQRDRAAARADVDLLPAARAHGLGAQVLVGDRGVVQRQHLHRPPRRRAHGRCPGR